ncbi:putative cytochrome P450 YjiB [Brevibacillus reuszeri]|uniref:Cytochrome P450 n=1 Tax=Brevibacillus reuszeri TaxID=54915 RepID=A0A0K9YJ97_9BACL|nr:cytochrome P450 [Brevibacillus reuszeri]KNB68739.1 cytochrome P450 [Brevibacillus reuszeri]MED1859037.1 cytochrome P450 [Brevibacillus reuszeri]GED69255.1 putative cytochrome P450 YjiB [Brevibacillus reuszeri]
MQTTNKARYANIIPMEDLNTIEKKLDPFPIFAQLRGTTPVRYDENRKCWDVFRYEDAHQVLKDPATFSSKRGGEENESLLMMDPPRHTQMRALVSKAFTPKVIADLAPRIQSITDELLDAVQSDGKMDMVHDLAVPLPVIVIAELLGVPTKDRKLFKDWSDILVKGPAKNTEELFVQVMAERTQARQELDAYFAEIMKLRRQEPQDDLISLLLSADIEGEKLDDKEIIIFSILLLAAGNETTTNLITNAVRRLTEDQSLQQTLHEQPALVPGFIEEVLRYYPPVQAIGRITTKDVQIGDVPIQAGEQVISWVASANRDEAKFPDPDTFIVDRKPNAHLAFGFGIHFCLGAPLARLEGQIAIQAIARRLQHIRFVEGTPLTPIPSPFVYGVKEFPVTFEISNRKKP